MLFSAGRAAQAESQQFGFLFSSFAQKKRNLVISEGEDNSVLISFTPVIMGIWMNKLKFNSNFNYYSEDSISNFYFRFQFDNVSFDICSYGYSVRGFDRGRSVRFPIDP